MNMNRNRLNQMRQMDRGNEGLQQVIQMQAAPCPGAQNQNLNQQGHDGGQNPATQTVRRKTTYTRTEMLSRGLPTAQNRRPAGQDWANQLSPKQRNYSQPPKAVIPATPLVQSTNATNKSTRSFLPRVARLPAKSDRSPNRMQMQLQNRLGPRETETKVEQSQIPVGSHKTMHLVNSPEDSQSDHFISDSGGSSERHKIKLAKAIRLPDDQNKSFVYLCKPVKKVKELLTARRLRHSCEHLEGDAQEADEEEEGDFFLEELESPKKQTISEEALRSKGGYTLAPIEGLTQSSSSTSQLDSPTLEAMEQRQQQFEAQAVSSQERLRNRLLEVRQRQRQLLQLEQEQRHQEQRQLCQNLPTLQHEIRMLQQLSDKLEATMRVSYIPKPLTPKKRSYNNDTSQESNTRFYTPRSSPYQLELELPITKLCCLSIEQIPVVTQRTRIIAKAHHFGLVQEFRIETKTLNELKTADDSQCFYLPAAKEADPLQRTNFRKLRENPSILLQQLRPLIAGSGRPFNLLDQDTMFFNSLALEPLEVATREAGGGGASIAHYYSRLSVARSSAADQGDQVPSQVHNTTQTDLESPRKMKIAEPETEISSPDYSPNPSPRLIKRKKLELEAKSQETRKPDDPKPKKTRIIIRRVAPEPPIQSRVEPKVRMQLLKTVLVGMVQVAVILVLIMAFTYPDVSC
ncbi:uncharacterized protein [Drosophila takahashii]|uniref:uncharacterized protein n=1 Tax=Drosophila takahashii TaxID=29030 RepID=UPI001CF849DA|nr:uncharacterized protein LOC108065658 [Drosophila takahashii]